MLWRLGLRNGLRVQAKLGNGGLDDLSAATIAAPDSLAASLLKREGASIARSEQNAAHGPAFGIGEGEGGGHGGSLGERGSVATRRRRDKASTLAGKCKRRRAVPSCQRGQMAISLLSALDRHHH